jgi:hypothetical protein
MKDVGVRGKSKLAWGRCGRTATQLRLVVWSTPPMVEEAEMYHRPWRAFNYGVASRMVVRCVGDVPM